MINMQDPSSLPSKLFCSHTSNPKYKQTHRQWLANLGNTQSFSNCRESSNIPLLLWKECSSGQQTPNHSTWSHSGCCCCCKALMGKIPQISSQNLAMFLDVPRSSMPQSWLAWVKNPRTWFAYFLIYISYLQ